MDASEMEGLLSNVTEMMARDAPRERIAEMFQMILQIESAAGLEPHETENIYMEVRDGDEEDRRDETEAEAEAGPEPA